jgi:cell division protein FtsZ
MPNSLVKNALGSEFSVPVEKATYSQPAPDTPPVSKDDEELAKIASALDVCIKIIGCGGGGTNTITRCYDSQIQGAQMCAVNTDAKHLLSVHSPRKILIGKRLTQGLGAGAIPEVGEEAAREADPDIRSFLQGGQIVFITAGMGGGTGTGSAHYVARLAKEMKALTIGVVTLPFKAEGDLRMENAMAGLEKLRRICDTTIVIPNDKLLDLVPKLPIEAAFKVADEVLMQTLKGLTEIVTKPGLVNLDYADIMTVMNEGGVAFVGIGESTSDDKRIEEAVSEALNSPLLGEINLSESAGCLIRVTGGHDLTISEAEKAAEIVSSTISRNARIIWGCSVDDGLEGTVRVLLIVTGARSKYMLAKEDNVETVPEVSRAVHASGYSSQNADDGIDTIR